MEMIRLRYLPVAALALLVGIAASQPASAAVIANGSFTFNPSSGAVIVDTGDITLLTASKTEPALAVTSVSGNIGLAFSTGAVVSILTEPIPIAPVLSTASINETMTIAAQVFTFTSEETCPACDDRLDSRLISGAVLRHPDQQLRGHIRYRGVCELVRNLHAGAARGEYRLRQLCHHGESYS